MSESTSKLTVIEEKKKEKKAYIYIQKSVSLGKNV